MTRSSRTSWENKLRQARLEYVFRAYARVGGEFWSARHSMLCRHASECGDHRQWSEDVVVDGEWQQWIVWGFKDHRRKLAFEAGMPEIMAREWPRAAE